MKDENIYSSSLIKIPTPKFVVFYNGKAKQPERQRLRLSEAFSKKTEEVSLVQDGLLTCEQAAACSGLSAEEFEKKCKACIPLT